MGKIINFLIVIWMFNMYILNKYIIFILIFFIGKIRWSVWYVIYLFVYYKILNSDGCNVLRDIKN